MALWVHVSLAVHTVNIVDISMEIEDVLKEAVLFQVTESLTALHIY